MKYLFLLILLIVSAQLFSQNNIEFVENKGQWIDKALFKAEIEGGALWIEANTFTYDFVSQEDMDDVNRGWHGDNREEFIKTATIRHHVYKVAFIGANEDVVYTSKETLSKYNNYFIGNDPTKWAGKVPISKAVYANSLYTGIDIESYSKGGHLKYDLIVKPGADPSQIKMRYEGAAIKMANDDLVVDLSIGKVIEQAPIAYQIIDQERVAVLCNYRLEGDILQFDFPKGFNEDYPLIIDPELIFSTYSGSLAGNFGFTATYDDQGHLYGGGIVFSSGYPTTTGAFQTDFAASIDAGISKYTEDGTEQVFATYLGGSNEDNPHSLMVDSDNNLVVFGSTNSASFPTTTGAYDEEHNGDYDIYISKFNEDGSDLLASTFVGGSDADGRNNSLVLSHNYGDGARGEVFVAANDQIFIASCSNSDDLPTTNSSVQQGALDGCAFLFTPELDSMIFGTFIGGSEDDAAYSIKAEEGIIVLAGGTVSEGFPISSDAYNSTYNGGTCDGFVLTLDLNGNIIRSTYTGTDSYDQVYFVDFGTDNSIFVAGQTTGAFPVSSNVYSNDGGTQFLQEFNIDLSESLTSTVFGTGGGSTDISLTAFMIDICGHAYVSGFGSTSGLPITSDAFQSTSVSNDFYFIVFDTGFEDLLYATFFGGAQTSEHVDGGTSRFDDNGIIYQAVCVCGTDFPTTENAYSTGGSGGCNLGSIKMEFNLLGLNFQDQIEDTLFCENPPFIIPFEGAGELIANHYWNFGDGSTSNETDPIHEYSEAGFYEIEYIVMDSNSCFISDTAYYEIEIAQKEAFTFDYETTNPSPCSDTLKVDMAFTGTSADVISWDMGDGTFYFADTISHYYTEPGEYTVLLSATDTYCDHSDEFEQVFTLYDQSLAGELLIPNIFSPNRDFVNEYFKLYNTNGDDPLEVLNYYHVLIYDRWGKSVFESGETIKDWVWDGTIDGKDADEGVYFYIISYNNLCESSDLITISGYITLVR